MRKKTSFQIFVLFFCCFYSESAWVAPAAKLRLTEVNDLNLGTWAQASMTGNDPVCVYRNDSIDTYHVTGTDNSTISPSSLALENAAKTSQIAYTLNWSNTSSPGAINLADGVLTAASGANITQQTCSGGDSSNFKVDINNSALAAAPNGTYTATVTFVIQE